MKWEYEYFGKKHRTGSVMEHNKAEHIRVLPEIILRDFLHLGMLWSTIPYALGYDMENLIISKDIERTAAEKNGGKKRGFCVRTVHEIRGNHDFKA